MARPNTYNSAVAARTRLAQLVHDDAVLRAAYEALGGLPEDLEEIARRGHLAEAANLGQSTAEGEGKGATGAVLLTFEKLRGEYSSVMGIVQAVKSDLTRANAGPQLIAAIDQIIENEVPVRIVAAEKDGTTTKTARKVRSLEAMRAEIQKDATALLGLKDAHPALTKRKVDESRLRALADGAAKLEGQLGERTMKKGAAKGATAAEREAVTAQKEIWSATYRILAALGQKDPRVAQMLTEAAW